jgi:hypothetical protein
MPLNQTRKAVAQAQKLLKAGKYYEANLVPLRGHPCQSLPLRSLRVERGSVTRHQHLAVHHDALFKPDP